MELNFNVSKENLLTEKTTRNSGHRNLLYDFQKSGEDVAEVKEFVGKAALTAHYIRKVAKTAGFVDIDVLSKGGRIFLIRKEG